MLPFLLSFILKTMNCQNMLLNFLKKCGNLCLMNSRIKIDTPVSIHQYHKLESFYILILHKVDFILKVATLDTLFWLFRFKVEHIERKQTKISCLEELVLSGKGHCCNSGGKNTAFYSLPRAKCFTRQTCELNSTRGKAYKFYTIFIH